MNEMQKQMSLTGRTFFDSRWGQWLRHPFWYVTVVVLVTLLTFFLRPLWWLAGAVALTWGAWLLWQLFRDDKAPTHPKEQLEGYLAQTLVYKAQIRQIFKTTLTKSNSAQRQQITAQIDGWIEAIQHLVRHIDRLRQDPLIQQDLLTVPQAIADLEAQLASESDPLIRAQLERTLLHRKNQLASLELLQNSVKQAEIQLESTLSLLGTIYSHILAGQSTRYLANYERLSSNVDEEVQRLQDQLEALREVKSQYRAITH
jgi:hypothetical protein